MNWEDVPRLNESSNSSRISSLKTSFKKLLQSSSNSTSASNSKRQELVPIEHDDISATVLKPISLPKRSQIKRNALEDEQLKRVVSVGLSLAGKGTVEMTSNSSAPLQVYGSPTFSRHTSDSSTPNYLSKTSPPMMLWKSDSNSNNSSVLNFPNQYSSSELKMRKQKQVPRTPITSPVVTNKIASTDNECTVLDPALYKQRKQSNSSSTTNSSDEKKKTSVPNTAPWYVARIISNQLSQKQFRQLSTILQDGSIEFINEFIALQGVAAICVQLKNQNRRSIKTNDQLDMENSICMVLKALMSYKEGADSMCQFPSSIHSCVPSLISARLSTRKIISELLMLLIYWGPEGRNNVLIGLDISMKRLDQTSENRFKPWLDIVNESLDLKNRKRNNSKLEMLTKDYSLATLFLLNALLETEDSLNERMILRQQLDLGGVMLTLTKMKSLNYGLVLEQIEKFEDFKLEDTIQVSKDKESQFGEFPSLVTLSDIDYLLSDLSFIASKYRDNPDIISGLGALISTYKDIFKENEITKISKTFKVLSIITAQTISSIGTSGELGITLSSEIHTLIDRLATEDVARRLSLDSSNSARLLQSLSVENDELRSTVEELLVREDSKASRLLRELKISSEKLYKAENTNALLNLKIESLAQDLMENKRFQEGTQVVLKCNHEIVPTQANDQLASLIIRQGLQNMKNKSVEGKKVESPLFNMANSYFSDTLLETTTVGAGNILHNDLFDTEMKEHSIFQKNFGASLSSPAEVYSSTSLAETKFTGFSFGVHSSLLGGSILVSGNYEELSLNSSMLLQPASLSNPPPPPPPPLPTFLNQNPRPPHPLKNTLSYNQDAPLAPPLPQFLAVQKQVPPPPAPPLPPLLLNVQKQLSTPHSVSPLIEKETLLLIPPPPPLPLLLQIKKDTLEIPPPPPLPPSTEKDTLAVSNDENDTKSLDTTNSVTSKSLQNVDYAQNDEISTSFLEKLPKPRRKLKQIHWDKIENDKIDNTFWGELDGKSGIGENVIKMGILDEVETHFAIKQTTIKTNPKVRHQENKMKSFLSRDLAQQFGINLHPLSGLSVEDLVLQVLHCEKIVMDNVQILEFFNKDELTDISNNLMRNFKPYSTDYSQEPISSPSKDASELERHDRIFLELCFNLRGYWKSRSRSLLLVKTYLNNFHDLNKKIEIIDSAVLLIKSSESFKEVMSLIRTMGNFMNNDSRKALGFKLSTLQRLKFMKDGTNTISFLHYIEKTIRCSFSELGEFVDDLNIVVIASKISVENIIQECEEYARQINNCIMSVEQGNLSDKTIFHPEDKIIEVLSKPLNSAKYKNSVLQKKIQLMIKNLNDLLDYFGETNKSDKNGVFNVLAIFIEEFKKAHLENIQKEEEQRVYENRQKLIEEKKQKRKEGKENGEETALVKDNLEQHQLRNSVMDSLLERLKNSTTSQTLTQKKLKRSTLTAYYQVQKSRVLISDEDEDDLEARAQRMLQELKNL